MTPEAQNIAIAEACGKEFHRPTAEEIKSGSYYQYEPDYTRDLNACHEMEKVLTEEQLNRYADILCDMVAEGDPDPNISGLLTIDASQRAEAFLKTIGKWVE